MIEVFVWSDPGASVWLFRAHLHPKFDRCVAHPHNVHFRKVATETHGPPYPSVVTDSVTISEEQLRRKVKRL